MAKHVALVVYEKFQAGDHIGNAELANALAFFKSMAENLSVLGPVFHLAWMEAHRTYTALKGYSVAREN